MHVYLKLNSHNYSHGNLMQNIPNTYLWNSQVSITPHRCVIFTSEVGKIFLQTSVWGTQLWAWRCRPRSALSPNFEMTAAGARKNIFDSLHTVRLLPSLPRVSLCTCLINCVSVPNRCRGDPQLRWGGLLRKHLQADFLLCTLRFLVPPGKYKEISRWKLTT